MKDKEEILKIIDDIPIKLCDFCDCKIDDELKEIVEYIDSLNKKIEKMKCCLTCEHYTEREDQEGYVICDGCIDFNLWQLKENKTE